MRALLRWFHAPKVAAPVTLLRPCKLCNVRPYGGGRLWLCRECEKDQEEAA